MHSSMRSGFSSCKCMSTRSSAYWHFSSYVFGKLRRARSCSTVSRDFSMIFMCSPVHDAQELRQNNLQAAQCLAQFRLEYTYIGVCKKGVTWMSVLCQKSTMHIHS